MQFLGLLLLGPWLLILAWAYWSYPKSLPRTAARRLLDMVILALAFVLAVVLTEYGFSLDYDPGHPNHVTVWQMAAPILYAYGGFSAALVLGLVARGLIWRQPRRV
jgi:hypothetical protein